MAPSEGGVDQTLTTNTPDPANPDCCNKTRWWPLWLLGGLILLFLIMIIILRGLCTDVWYINLLGLNDKLCGGQSSLQQNVNLEDGSIRGPEIAEGAIGLDNLSPSLQVSINNINNQLANPVPGPQGATGASGFNGAAGANGPTGPQGPAGPAGPTDPCVTNGTYFCQNGNNYGTLAVLGTNDAQDLEVETAGARTATFDVNGNLSLNRADDVYSGGTAYSTFDSASLSNIITTNCGLACVTTSFQNSSANIGWGGGGNVVDSFSNLGTLADATNVAYSIGLFQNVVDSYGLIGRATDVSNSDDLIGGFANVTNSNHLFGYNDFALGTNTIDSSTGSIIAQGSGAGNTAVGVVNSILYSSYNNQAEDIRQSILLTDNDGTFDNINYSYSNGYLNDLTNIDFSTIIGADNTISDTNNSFISSTGGTHTGLDNVLLWSDGSNIVDNVSFSMIFGTGNNTSSSNSVTLGTDNVNSGQYAVVFGNDNEASGINSTAFGFETVASGLRSTAFGNRAVASGVDSVAFGSQADSVGPIASGQASTAFGTATLASGTESTAFGYVTTAAGNRSTAFGNASRADGSSSTAFGLYTEASGLGSTAFGNDTTASGQYSTAFGNTTLATGDSSIAAGNGSTANGANSIALGSLATADGISSLAIGIGNCLPGAPLAYANGQGAAAIGCVEANADGAMAFGYNNYANANASVAIGGNLTVDSTGGVALGTTNSIAVGSNYSTVFGSLNTIQTGAAGATVFGNGNSALTGAGYSTVFGDSNTTDSYLSTVFGGNNIIQNNSDASVVFGGSNLIDNSIISTASGQENTITDHEHGMAWGFRNDIIASSLVIPINDLDVTVWGYDNTGAGNSTTVFGNTNSADGEFNTAFGFQNTVEGSGNVAWGANNSILTSVGYASGSSTVWGIGNSITGANSTAFGADMTVSGNNSVGIGLGTGGPYTVSNNNTLAIAGGTVDIGDIVDGGASTDYVCVDVNGVLVRQAGVCNVSSERYKHNIQDLSLGLDDLMKLRAVSFNYNTDDRAAIGFVAEEAAKVDDRLVFYRDGKIEGFNYDMVTALITKAIQDQNGKLEGINTQLAEQGLRIDGLAGELKALAEQVNQNSADIQKLQQENLDYKAKLEDLETRLEKVEQTP